MDVLSIVVCLSGTFANFTGAAFDPGAVAAIVNDQLQNISLQSAEGFDGSVSFLHDLGDDRTLSFKGALSYLDSSRRITANLDRKSPRLNSSPYCADSMPSSACQQKNNAKDNNQYYSTHIA